jgi:hypothetical protein
MYIPPQQPYVQPQSYQIQPQVHVFPPIQKINRFIKGLNFNGFKSNGREVPFNQNKRRGE